AVEHCADFAQARGKTADADRQSEAEAASVLVEFLACRAIAQTRGQSLQRGLVAKRAQKQETRIAVACRQIVGTDVRGDECADLAEQCIEREHADTFARARSRI